MKVTGGQRLGDALNPYLTRWVLDFGKFALRLHHWQGSDDLRAPHDHAWDFWSILLSGEMTDRTPSASGGYVPDAAGTTHHDTPRRWLRPTFYPAEHRHSVVVGGKGAWTLLLTGPERRDWGFYTPKLGGKEAGTVRFRNRNKYFHTEGHH